MRQPEPGTMQYTSFVNEIDNGNLKIPQFQREFVWSKSQSAKLIDSIIKGYPIGTFILWKTKERLRTVRNLGRIELPDTPPGDFVYYVLDGQQRMTSLYSSIKGAVINREGNKPEDFSEIYIDLDASIDDDEDIVVIQKGQDDESRYISLKELINGGLLTLVTKYNEVYHPKIDLYQKNLNSYLFSTITIQDAPIDVATEIFTRINIGGKPLSVFEIMCAKTYDVERAFDLAERFEGLSSVWEDCGYDTISSSTVLQAVSVCLVKECSKKHILSLNKNDFIEIWDKVCAAFNSAIDYFRNFYHIPVSQLLPYDGLLVPFTYFFFHHPDRPTGTQKDYLQDYFWRAALASRFSSALETKVGQDIKRIETILENEEPTYDYGVDISIEGLSKDGYFSVNKAYIKALLCILASKSPLSFVDGAKVNIDNSWLKQANSKNYHHFFPKAYLKKQNQEDFYINHIANITIVDDFLNKRLIRDKSPSKYMGDFSSKNENIDDVMKTHLIFDLEQFGVWDDNYDRFFEQRLASIRKELKKRIRPTKLDKV